VLAKRLQCAVGSVSGMAFPGMAGAGAAGAGAAPVPGIPPEVASSLPIPLPDWLIGNPYFAAGFGLAGIGVAGSFLRVGSASLEVVARRQLLMTLEIPSKDYSYQWVMQWLVARGVHGSKHIGVETTYTKNASGHAMAHFDFIPSPGRHWVRYKGSFMCIERERETRSVDMSTGAPWETLTLKAFAWNPKLFHELLEEAKMDAMEREEGKTIIYQVYGHEWKPFGSARRIRPFNSVVMDEGVADYVCDDVQDFLSNQGWYLERGIPYRRGYLLHGPPGCGKTSYVSALAGKLGYNICVLNLGDPGMTDDRLSHILAMVPPRCLVLLEDIDFAVGKDAKMTESGPYAGVMRVSFSGLLNAMDGVVATEERLIFMTTNHYDKLPKVLIRPGRVDLSVYVGLASKQQLYQMFIRFFPGEETMGEQFAVLCEGEGLSMAELQGFFMFFKNQPEKAAANIGPYLQSRREAHQEIVQKPAEQASVGQASAAPASEALQQDAEKASEDKVE